MSPIVSCADLKTWFVLDLVSTIPYDLFTFSTTTSEATADGQSGAESAAMLRMLKLCKLVKLMRILKSAKTFTRVTNALSMTNAQTDLIKYMLMVFVFVHWGACVWRMAPDILTFKTTWLNVDTDMLVTESTTSLYLMTVEFSLMSLVMGYGSVEPQNPGSDNK